VDDLITWFREQLDDDERIASAAGSLNSTWREVGRTGVIVCSEGGRAEELIEAHIAPPAPHITRFDPARVLREVEAKRRLVELHSPGSDPCDAHDASLRSVPCEVIELLALPFSDRPGYREEWRP
jgi:hypothetical protein